MSNAALAFFTGMGKGYLQTKDSKEEKARRDRLDQRDQDEHDARMRERRKKEQADAMVAQAAQPMVAGANGVSKPAAADDRDLTAGSDAVAATQPTAIANTAGGVRARQVAALQGLDPERADRLALAGKQAELTDLQLDSTKKTLTREELFRTTAGLVARAGWGAIPKIYERYEDGNTAKVEEDGKGGATVIAYGKDGKEVGRQAYGDLQEFMVGVLPQLDPKLWVQENRSLRKDKADQAHREATLSETARHNKATEREAAARTGIAAAAEKRAAAAAAPGVPTFDPLGGFDGKKAQAVAFEQASKEATESAAMGKPMSAQEQAMRAQQIYQNTADAFAAENTARERAKVFRATARTAKTPEEIEAVRARAAQSGFTAEEMAALDPRFAVKRPATPPPAAARSAPAAARGLPRSLAEIPGAQTETKWVTRGTDLVAR